MATECYAMVRGSAIRVTSLDRCGAYDEDAIQYAVSKSVIRVRINEVVEAGANEVQRNVEDERRLHLVRPAQTIRYTADIEFLRVDPGLLSLVTGVPLVYRDVPGFGEVPFGMAPFGGSWDEAIVSGFDMNPRQQVASFALEVWTKIAGAVCAEDQRWGYTLFPFLKGGRISGFTFANSLVSFNLVGARTQRVPKWGFGPYDLDAPWCRLVEPVSRNTHWRQTLVSQAPPTQTDGITVFVDEIDGGTATMTTDDEIDGGDAFTAGPCFIDGGVA